MRASLILIPVRRTYESSRTPVCNKQGLVSGQTDRLKANFQRVNVGVVLKSDMVNRGGTMYSFLSMYNFS